MAFLDGMPSYNSASFTKFKPDAHDNHLTKRKLSLYVSTSRAKPDQVIKKDRSNILLRYLYKKYYINHNICGKRKNDGEDSGGDEPKAKRGHITQSSSSSSQSSAWHSSQDS